MPGTLGGALAILMVVLGLGLVIFLHEFGHFVMAKRNGVRVEIFSLGFGPAIWSFRRGETEYRVSWIPLGGYVKMAGENMAGENRKGEPWELTSKTPWQRFQIFVAGAVMNLILAFPLAILAFVIGQYRESNEVGVPGTAEAHAEVVLIDGKKPAGPAEVEKYSGMRPGDVILDVDGRSIESVHTYRIEMIRRGSGQKVPVTVRRGDQEIVLHVTTMSIPYHVGTGPRNLSLPAKQFKKDSPAERKIVEVLKDKGGTEVDETGTHRLKYDLLVTSANGEPIFGWSELDQAFRKNPGKAVTLGIRWQNDDNEFDSASVTLAAPARTVYTIPSDDHLIPCKVGRALDGTPAFGKLGRGDRIVKIGDQEIQSWQDLKEIVQPNPRKMLEFHVEGKREPILIRPATSPQGLGVIGIRPEAAMKELPKYPLIAKIVEGSYFHRMGLRAGDRIISMEGKGGEIRLSYKSKEEPGIMGYRSDKEKTISIEVQREGKRVNVDLVAEEEREGDLVALGLPATPDGLLILKDRTLFFHRDESFGKAVESGLREPLDITVMTFQFLHKLITAQASPKLLSGPVGIAHASYKFAELHFGNFLWLLCVITVNLGIFNLLPIPVLDGGHNVLLLIEVIRKKFGKPPPSEKFVATFQYVGLLFILALVVFVTFNDIGRLFP